MSKKNKHLNQIDKLILFILTIVAIIFVATFLYKNAQSTSLKDWQSYSSNEFNYLLRYPEGWTVYSPTQNESYEGNILFVSDLGQNNLQLTATNKKDSVSYEDTVELLKYWNWEDKKTGYGKIGKNKLNSFWMTGISNGKKQKVWIIEGTEHIYTISTILDYNPEQVEHIVSSIQLVK